MHTDTTMRRPPARTGQGRIVISALKPKNRRLGKMPREYVNSLRRAGGVPAVVSTYALEAEPAPSRPEVFEEASVDDTRWIEEASGLVLTGGGDVDPVFFGAERHPRTYNVMRRRDRFEFNLLAAALRRDMPVLAICRGMQVLNVGLGGTLDQHLMDDPDRLDHDRDVVRGEPAHPVRVQPGSLLSEILEATELGVNSHHHQALERVARPLRQVAWAPDGVLEGVESVEHSWVVGVQWHPEVMSSSYREHRALFEAFVRATQDFAEASFREDVRSA